MNEEYIGRLNDEINKLKNQITELENIHKKDSNKINALNTVIDILCEKYIQERVNNGTIN